MKKFSEIEYKRPDFEALRNSYATLMERFKKAKTYEEARELFLAIQHADDDAATMATVASIRNTADLSDKFYEDEDLFISGEFAKLAPFMAKVNKAIVKSKFRSRLEEEFGNILFRDVDTSHDEQKRSPFHHREQAQERIQQGGRTLLHRFQGGEVQFLRLAEAYGIDRPRRTSRSV